MCVCEVKDHHEKQSLLYFHCAYSVLLDHLDLGGERFCHCVTVTFEASDAGFQSVNTVTKEVKWSEVKAFLIKNYLATWGYD